jgi:hypothetical protein
VFTYYAEKTVVATSSALGNWLVLSIHTHACHASISIVKCLRGERKWIGSARVFLKCSRGEDAQAQTTSCHGCTVDWVASTADNLENVFMHADGVL